MATGGGTFLLPPQNAGNSPSLFDKKYKNINEENKNIHHSKSSSLGGINNSMAKLAANSYWHEGTIAQYIITDKQYEKLFSNEELADAPRILQKLK